MFAVRQEQDHSDTEYCPKLDIDSDMEDVKSLSDETFEIFSIMSPTGFIEDLPTTQIAPSIDSRLNDTENFVVISPSLETPSRKAGVNSLMRRARKVQDKVDMALHRAEQRILPRSKSTDRDAGVSDASAVARNSIESATSKKTIASEL